MVKLTALYRKPEDAARFEQIYFGQHVPLAKKMPGLRKFEVNRVAGAPRGEPEYYLTADLYFDDMEAMRQSMASEESRAAARTLRDAGAQVTMLLAEVQEV